MLFRRKIIDQIVRYIDSKEIIVLTGMRQVGKTSLYRILYQDIQSDNKLFLDLENPIDQKIFEEKDYNNIIHNFKYLGLNIEKKMYVFLDEIQAMPEVVSAIKYLHDHYDVKFFVTGSSSFYLKNLFPESLAGRKYAFELFPLDFEEMLIFKNFEFGLAGNFTETNRNKSEIVCERLKSVYEEYLQFGGFPGVVLAESFDEKKMKLKDIFKSYFEKDVRNLADFRDVKALRDLIIVLMQRAGSKLDVTKLSSEIGVSRETIYSYINFLEGTYFVHFITPYAKNVDREVSGSRKVYLCDTGMLNHFAKLSEGSLFENAVFLNLRKYGKINYYQRRSGAEVDFIVNESTALEVKIKGVLQDLKKVKKITSQLGMKEGYVVTKTYNGDDGFIPATFL